MTTKEEMLGRIRSALSDVRKTSIDEPPVPEIWKSEGLSIDELGRRFTENLIAVKGEIISCDNFNDAVTRIKATLKGIDANKIAVTDSPLSRDVAEKLSDKELFFRPENPSETDSGFMATLDAGLVSPELLLADTGSCLFSAPTAFERLATYIPPVSLVVAKKSMLREHLPAAWSEIKSRLGEAKTGEFVIVTGPSRTADIEKILILGVHGPKRVLVFLIDDEF